MAIIRAECDTLKRQATALDKAEREVSAWGFVGRQIKQQTSRDACDWVFHGSGCGFSRTGLLIRLKPKLVYRIAASFAISSALSARSNTATPPIHPVKPTLRLLWMTRPMVKGPPLPSLAGV